MNEKMLTIDVSNVDNIKKQMKAAFRGKADATCRYSFDSRANLLRTLSPNRWGLIKALPVPGRWLCAGWRGVSGAM